MTFTNLGFLYVFLPVVYVVFWGLRTKQQRYVWLTVASYVFYGYWNWKFCFWMFFSTTVSYVAGLGFLRWEELKNRRWCLWTPIVIDLLVLTVFKYANFTLGTLETVSTWFQTPLHMPFLSIVLPIGISFYTFHTISYIVDSYRRDVTPTRNFWEFACYVSLFSQLVAGPIVRFRQVEKDLENIDHASRRSTLDTGWSFFVLGLAKKVLIADTLAAVIDPALASSGTLGTAGAWLCVLGYTYQLYFDFSGYSDMAVGLGYMFGIRLPQNFASPYKADSISDFWRRWHISLSTCLRDYLYIPLGGGRGPAWFVGRNLLITMLLGGLWHGANWTFVFWGAYHGLLLIFMKVGEKQWERLPGPLRQSSTFLLVMIGWVFFRSPTFDMAVDLLRKMFMWHSEAPVAGLNMLVITLVVAGIFAHTGPNTFEIKHQWTKSQIPILALLLVTCLFALYGAPHAPFLYFQF